MSAIVHIQIDDPRAEKLGGEVLQSTVFAALEVGGEVSEPEVTVIITSSEEIQELNNKYRQIDAVTDVLSFSDGSINPENDRVYLGDVVIAYPVAEAQAEEDGHSTEQEIQLLMVHGILHLLGYDHSDEAGREAMWAVQKAALEVLGSPINSQNWT